AMDSPPHGWRKINMDGASKGNLGKSGGGAILRSSSHSIIASSAHNLSFGTNHHVEAMAILKGLELAIKIGNDPLQVESDSLNIINLLQFVDTESFKGGSNKFSSSTSFGKETKRRTTWLTSEFSLKVNKAGRTTSR
ncbi:hypothetical protein KI387_008904, partial [Taxus chinensis]